VTLTTTTETEYLHRYEYRYRKGNGQWSEPEIRYHNRTTDHAQAVRRHEECQDVEYKWVRKFEGIYGYSWKNCQLVERQTRVEVCEYELH
jgi:hypothetical protein